MIRKLSAIILCGLMLWWADSASSQTITLKAEHDMTNQSIAHQALEVMAKSVLDKTNGRLKMQLYPSLQLSGGNIPNMIRQTQMGADDLSLIPSSIYTTVQYEHGLWSLPFLFKDVEDAYLLANSDVGNRLAKIMEGKNLKTIAIWARGMRQVLNNIRTIREPKDIKGLTFRVPENPLYAETFKSLDARPVTIAWGEVHSALLLKTVDGMETPTNNIVTEKFYELLKYVTFWNYSTDMLLVSVNLDFWKKLPPDLQQALQDGAKAGGEFDFMKEKQAVEEAINLVKTKGMEVTLLSEKQHEAFANIIKPKVWPIFRDKIGSEIITESEKVLKQKK